MWFHNLTNLLVLLCFSCSHQQSYDANVSELILAELLKSGFITPCSSRSQPVLGSQKSHERKQKIQSFVDFKTDFFALGEVMGSLSHGPRLQCNDQEAEPGHHRGALSVRCRAGSSESSESARKFLENSIMQHFLFCFFSPF